RVEQPQVIVDLRRGADGRARIPDAVLLADRDRRADAFDTVDVRLFYPLDVPPLTLGVDRVERERRFARTADARHDDERARRERHVDVLEVMRAGAANGDLSPGLGHLCGEFRRGRNSPW